MGGFDCSGFANWILHGFHLDVPGANAASLYQHFSLPENHVSQDVQLGALVFYGNPAHHVAIALNGLRMIGAEGGDHTVVSKEIAVQKGACVRVVPIYEKDRSGIFMPRYEELPTP